jgi:hypothetical protein
MSGRTTDTTVTFRQPFMLKALERPQPEGTYKVIVEEDEIRGLTFLAFRRTRTTLFLPAIGVSGRAQESYSVDGDELAAVLDADALR